MRTLILIALGLISMLCGSSVAYAAQDTPSGKKRYCGEPGILDPEQPQFETFDHVDRVAILFWITGPFEIDEKDLPATLQRENLKKLVKDIFEERYRELDQGIITTNKRGCFNRKNQPVTLYDNKEKGAATKFYEVIKDEGTLAVQFYVQYYDVDAKNKSDEKKSKASDVVTMQITIKRSGHRVLDKIDFYSIPFTTTIYAEDEYLKANIYSLLKENIF